MWKLKINQENSWAVNFLKETKLIYENDIPLLWYQMVEYLGVVFKIDLEEPRQEDKGAIRGVKEPGSSTY